MKYYRCKCGAHEAWGSMPPAPCAFCRKCGSDLAGSPDTHRDPKPHDFRATVVETDEGPKPLSRCVYCMQSRGDIEKRAAYWAARDAEKQTP